jgi:NADH-quinone oxidoreductase subunit M
VIAVLMVLLPLAVAVALALAPRPIVHRSLAVLGVVATLALGLLALNGEGRIEVPWIESIGTWIAFDATGAGGVLARIAAAVMLPTVLWAGSRVQHRPELFLAWLLATLAGLNGIFLARDLVLFYVFWELTLLPSLALLGGWGLTHKRAALVKYLLYAVAGSFAMLISVLAVRPLSGAAGYRFDQLLEAAPLLDPLTQTWLFAGFAFAFAIKLPIFPLHAWLIDVNEQNHASGAADVAGTLYKVGGFGLFAWAIPLLPAGATALAPYGLALGAFTAVYGAMIATRHTHLKRILAYASLSHMGIVAVGLFSLHLAGQSGSMALLAAQMVTTGGLFLISGMLYDRRSSFDIDAFGGLAKGAPALATASLVVLFASIGVPGLANFPGEFLALLGAYQASPAAAVVAVLAVIAAGAVGVNLFQRLFQGESRERVRDVSPLEAAVFAPIVALTLWLGVAPAANLSVFERDAALAPPQVVARSVADAPSTVAAPFPVAALAEVHAPTPPPFEVGAPTPPPVVAAPPGAALAAGLARGGER